MKIKEYFICHNKTSEMSDNNCALKIKIRSNNEVLNISAFMSNSELRVDAKAEKR